MLFIISVIDLWPFNLEKMPPIIAYLFWLSLGLVLGCYWAIESVKYLNKYKD